MSKPKLTILASVASAVLSGMLGYGITGNLFVADITAGAGGLLTLALCTVLDRF